MAGSLLFLWLFMLAAATQGYKSCSEIQEQGLNGTATYAIKLDGKMYNVLCNMTSEPAETIIRALNAEDIRIEDPAYYSAPYSFVYEIKYSNISNYSAIKSLVDLSENCKQFVSYKCKNAKLFGDSKNLLSSWVTVDGTGKYYWGDCGTSVSGKPCSCDSGAGTQGTDQGFLTRKKDLPVKQVRFGGFKADSNVSFTVGDLVCYGDNQKGALTLTNGNSIVSMNLSLVNGEIKFKFKSSSSVSYGEKIISVIEAKNGKYVQVWLDSDKKLQISHSFTKDNKRSFINLDQEWHSLKLEFKNKNLHASIDGGKKIILIKNGVDAPTSKLVFGDPNRTCKSFIGCIKDLYIDDVAKELRENTMQDYVKLGCEHVNAICKHPTVPYLQASNCSGDSDGGKCGGGGSDNGTKGGDDGGDTSSSDNDEDGSDDNTAVIVIIVIFLLLLFLLLVAFFITWYLKRNKGVYQTHEGSAENLHGNNENLTLVTRPSEEDQECDKNKEYYL